MSNPGLLKRFFAFMIDYVWVSVLMFVLAIPLYHLTSGAVLPRLPVLHLTKVEPQLLDERQSVLEDKTSEVLRTYLLKTTYYGLFETYQIEDQVIHIKSEYTTRCWTRHFVEKDTAGEWQKAFVLTSDHLSWLMLFIVLVVFEASPLGASPGKRLLKLRTVDQDSQRLTFAASFKRNLLKVVSILPLGLGIFIALRSSKVLTLHDRLTKTQVISTKI